MYFRFYEKTLFPRWSKLPSPHLYLIHCFMLVLPPDVSTIPQFNILYRILCHPRMLSSYVTHRLILIRKILMKNVNCSLVLKTEYLRHPPDLIEPKCTSLLEVRAGEAEYWPKWWAGRRNSLVSSVFILTFYRVQSVEAEDASQVSSYVNI